MNIFGKFMAYFYALALSLWSICIPQGPDAGDLLPSKGFPTTTEKVSAFDQFGDVLLINQSHQWHIGKTFGNNSSFHFFNKEAFQFLFLKNLYATAFSFLKTHDLNFEFIDLIYPFHYFW